MRRRDVAIIGVIGLIVLPVVVYLVVGLVPGFAGFIVSGGSMEPTIDRGSLVYIQETSAYQPGDVITFTRGDRIITHRIVNRTADGYITRGDGNRRLDAWRVAEHQIQGEVVLVVPLYGYLLSFVQTPIGYAIVIFVPGTVLIGLEIRQFLKQL